MKTKEEIYDDEISPLMSQVIAICKQHKIATLCTFCLGDDEDGDPLMCTTLLSTEDYEPSERLLQAGRVIYPPPRQPLNMTIDHGDGSKEMITIM